MLIYFILTHASSKQVGIKYKLPPQVKGRDNCKFVSVRVLLAAHIQALVGFQVVLLPFRLE